jgi:hypothetical protein
VIFLHLYPTFTDKELIKLAEEQKQLEQDIEILNEFIYKLNTDNSVRTVMWDRDVRKSRTNFCKTLYS